MYIIEKRKNHFLYFLENDKFSNAYFPFKDFGEINGEELKKLKKNVENNNQKYKKFSLLYSKINFFKNEKIIELISLKTEETRKKYLSSVDELDIFEVNLLYLILKGIIKIHELEILGLKEKYVKCLLEKFNSNSKCPCFEYYIDDTTKKTYEVLENGKKIILPFQLNSVESDFKKNRKEKILKKIKEDRYY